MGSPSQKNKLIGYMQQETILPAVQLDTDHWAIIPHKVQWGKNSVGERQVFFSPAWE
jgi:hypothetical protein